MGNTKKLICYLVFYPFALIYFIFVDVYFPGYDYISMFIGIFLIITGMWGILVGQMLLRIPMPDEWNKLANILMVLSGIIFVVFWFVIKA